MEKQEPQKLKAVSSQKLTRNQADKKRIVISRELPTFEFNETAAR